MLMLFMVGLFYCRGCDFAFCREHLDHHPKTCGGYPNEVAAAAVGATFCSACVGILPAQRRGHCWPQIRRWRVSDGRAYAIEVRWLWWWLVVGYG